MPKFSNQLIQGLTNPTYSDKLAQAGMLLGSAPRRAREEEARKERYQQSQAITNQGMQGAQAGEVPRLDIQIAKMQELAAASPSAKERAVLEGKVNTLQGMRQAAIGQQSKNHVGAVLKIDEMLKDKSSLDPRAVKAFEDRREQLLQNVDVERDVTRVNVERIKADKAAKEQAGDVWMQNTAPRFQQAISEGDSKTVDALLATAPQGQNLAAQQYVNAVTLFKQGVKEYEDRQADRTKRINDKAVTPDVESSETLIAELPEQFKKRLEPYLKNVREAAKGWDSKNGWGTGAQGKYTAAVKSFSNAAYQSSAQAASEAFREDNAVEAKKQESVDRIELLRRTPIKDADVRARALFMADGKKEKAPDKMADARIALTEEKNKFLNAQLQYINRGQDKTEKPSEEYQPLSRMDLGASAVSQAKEKGISYASVKASLKKKNYTEEEIATLLKSFEEDGAFGGSYMSSKFLAPEAEYVESLRAKLAG